jgi:methylmalonyl-CoA mutase cobalamin-binding domain/chain
MSQKIRVVIAKPGLDGHDRGAKVIARVAHLLDLQPRIVTAVRDRPNALRCYQNRTALNGWHVGLSKTGTTLKYLRWKM